MKRKAYRRPKKSHRKETVHANILAGLSTTTKGTPLGVGGQPRHQLGNHYLTVGCQIDAVDTPTQSTGGKDERHSATTDPLAELGQHGLPVHAQRGPGNRHPRPWGSDPRVSLAPRPRSGIGYTHRHYRRAIVGVSALKRSIAFGDQHSRARAFRAINDAVNTPRTDVDNSLSPPPRFSARTACAHTQITFSPGTPAPSPVDRLMYTS